MDIDYIVYKATHLPTGKSYVGQTSKKLEVRIGQHWAETRNRFRKFNQFLHSTKMNEWSWEILTIVRSKKEARDAELYYITKWNLYEEGLNLKTGILYNKNARLAASKRMQEYKASNPEPWNKGRNGVYSEETLEKMRLAKLMNPSRVVFTEDLKEKMSLAAPNRKIVVELKSGLEFASISAAARHFKLRREAVRDVVNGKRSHTAGYVFSIK